jgi:hypothetical protein
MTARDRQECLCHREWQIAIDSSPAQVHRPAMAKIGERASLQILHENIFKTDRNYQESYLRFQSLSFDSLFASQMLSSSNRMIYLCRARAGDAAD